MVLFSASSSISAACTADTPFFLYLTVLVITLLIIDSISFWYLITSNGVFKLVTSYLSVNLVNASMEYLTSVGKSLLNTSLPNSSFNFSTSSISYLLFNLVKPNLLSMFL